MSKDNHRALDQLLALTDDNDFVHGLLSLDTLHVGMPLHERPVPLAMLLTVCALHIDLALDGIAKFLTQQEGAGFSDAFYFCRISRAARAAEYLTAVAALFPKRKVPKDDAEREAIVFGAWEESSPLDRVDAFPKLDREYREDALREIAGSLRAYVRKNRRLVEEALATPAPKERTAADEIEEMEDAVVGLEEAAQRMEDEASALQLLAEARGTHALDGSDDPRVVAFMASLETFSVKQWVQICDRFLEKPSREMNRALGVVAGVASDLITGRLLGKERGKLVLDAALRVRDRSAPAMAALPATVKRGREAFELRKTVLFVANSAWQALSYYDWLVVTKEGTRAAKALLMPFANLAALPTEIKEEKKRKRA